jgi:hypothetical protein
MEKRSFQPSGRLLDCPPHHLRNGESLPKQWGTLIHPLRLRLLTPGATPHKLWHGRFRHSGRRSAGEIQTPATRRLEERKETPSDSGNARSSAVARRLPGRISSTLRNIEAARTARPRSL